MSDHVFTKLDASWLHMDEPTNRMVINGFFRFASALDLERLKAALAQGFAPFARFRQRVADERSFLGRPRWIDDESFEIANHVERIQVPDPGDEAMQRATIEALLAQPLDPRRPLWKVYLLECGGGGCLVFFRIHHCIGDGIALLQVLLSMCAAEQGERAKEAPRASVRKRWYWWAALPITGTLYAVHFLWISLWLLIRPADPQTVFRGNLGVAKRTAWCRPLLLADVSALARAAGCKINDVLLATVAGAMRRYAKHHGRPLAPDCRVRCVVPVNLRPASKAKELGNYFAIVTPSLVVGEPLPQVRLAKIRRAMNALKRSPEGMVVVTVFRLLGALGVIVQSMILRLLASKTTVVVSNVPGPRSTLSFAGLRIEDIMFWVPMAGALGLGFSIFSYAGRVAIGVMSDVKLVPDPKRLADLLNHEFHDLQQTFGSQAAPGNRALGKISVEERPAVVDPQPRDEPAAPQEEPERLAPAQ